MKAHRADLHIHTLLSPCGNLEMSPRNIVDTALKKKLDIIGITDHNSTRHCKLISELAGEKGIFVLAGAEVTTKEEVHCLAFFPEFENLEIFQKYLDLYLTNIKNDVDKFGYQVQVDKDENIIYEEERLLIAAIDQSLEEVEKTVHRLNGLFIPAHINRPVFGLISQLGFIPEDLNFDALEISKHITKVRFLKDHPYLSNETFIQSSDSHFLENIGDSTSIFHLKSVNFEEIRLALKNEEGRFIEISTIT